MSQYNIYGHQQSFRISFNNHTSKNVSAQFGCTVEHCNLDINNVHSACTLIIVNAVPNTVKCVCVTAYFVLACFYFFNFLFNCVHVTLSFSCLMSVPFCRAASLPCGEIVYQKLQFRKSTFEYRQQELIRR